MRAFAEELAAMQEAEASEIMVISQSHSALDITDLYLECFLECLAYVVLRQGIQFVCFPFGILLGCQHEGKFMFYLQDDGELLWGEHGGRKDTKRGEDIAMLP